MSRLSFLTRVVSPIQILGPEFKAQTVLKLQAWMTQWLFSCHVFGIRQHGRNGSYYKSTTFSMAELYLQQSPRWCWAIKSHSVAEILNTKPARIAGLIRRLRMLRSSYRRKFPFIANLCLKWSPDFSFSLIVFRVHRLSKSSSCKPNISFSLSSGDHSHWEEKPRTAKNPYFALCITGSSALARAPCQLK